MKHAGLMVAAGLLLGLPPAHAAITWKADFETGTLDGWLPAQPPAGVTVVGEPKPAKAGFHAAEITSTGRTNELRRDLPAKSTADGREGFYAFHVFAPAALPKTPVSLARFISAKSGSPTLSFVATGEEVDLVTHLPEVKGHYRGGARLVAGKWNQVILHVVWSRDPKRGLAEVWFNGDKMIHALPVATTAGEPMTLAIGPSQETDGPTVTLLYDEISEATTLVDLRPPAFPSAPGDSFVDVTYARPGGAPLRLDAWVPKGPGPHPAVIIVHGGGFVRGDRQSYVRPLFDVLGGAGFAYFTIQYRLAPAHKYPAAVEDVEAAVKWVHQNARRYRVDRKRIVLFGESASGYLVSLVGTRHKRGGALAAVLPFYGSHEFKLPPPGPDGVVPVPKRGALVDFFGVTESSAKTAAALEKASPIRQVKADMPPYLIFHSKDDPQVPYAHSVAMCEAMKKAGASCDLLTAETLGHGLGKWRDVPAEHARLLSWLRTTLQLEPGKASTAP